jgi:hypothetical protein
MLKDKLMADLNILSLGAGVQSSTMALMAAKGEITPMPDAAIFADTGAEPQAVYDYLNWLEPLLPFPVYRVGSNITLTAAQLRTTTKGDGTEYVRNLLPAFTRNPDGSQGMLLRKCTGEYKITPIKQKVRELWKGSGAECVVQWIGISRDEAVRMKPSGVGYISHRWPLIELGMLRSNCLEWMERNGHPAPPKSACVYCPYHSDAHWRSMRDEAPDEFQVAVEFERAWNRLLEAEFGESKMRGEVRLHRSMVPLDQADLSTSEERGQPSLFNNECEGMCGV